jgi:molybdopterin-containing oxidoreductase family iron-sulfur binding subunit
MSGKPDNTSGKGATRRSFLAGAGAMASVITLTPGVVLKVSGAASASTGGKAKTPRWGILIDVRDCPDGCQACVTACSEEHGWSAKEGSTTDAQWIRKVELTDKATGAKTSLPVMCQHCESAPCVDVCPTSASYQRADGIVLVDKHRCIGCRYCMVACPFGARSFVHEDLSGQKPWSPRGKGTVESCNMCAHRVDDNKEPACVVACNKSGNRKMIFGDLNDPESEISKAVAKFPVTRLRADLGLNPGIMYTGV